MMNSHAYAISIEHTLRQVFNCDRWGLGGLIDADSIESNCYAPIAAGLGFLYATAESHKKKLIEKFIQEYNFYLKFGIVGLLSFTSSKKVIDKVEYELEYDNGEKALQALISALEEVCK